MNYIYTYLFKLVTDLLSWVVCFVLYPFIDLFSTFQYGLHGVYLTNDYVLNKRKSMIQATTSTHTQAHTPSQSGLLTNFQHSHST